MQYSCFGDMQDYDPRDCEPDIRAFRTGTATARKHHQCTGCSAGCIAPGDRYRYFVGLVDGAFQIDRMCLPGASAPGCNHEPIRPSPKAPPTPWNREDIPF